MAVTAASPQLVQAMMGACWEYLNSPSGLLADLPPRRQQEARETQIEVLPAASAEQVASVGGVPGRDLLLGLFTTPPARIRLFADAISALHEDVTDVLDHELGHRFGFDHTLHPAQAAILSRDGQPAQCSGDHHPWPTVADPDHPELALSPTDDLCPMCRLHSRTAEIRGLLDGLREEAFLAAQPGSIPLGLGGLIPLAKRKAGEARLALTQAAALVPDRGGETDRLDRLLQQLMAALSGQLDSDDAAAASDLGRRAHKAAFRLNHAYWLRVRHPEAQSPLADIL